jgi:hypothetical protein
MEFPAHRFTDAALDASLQFIEELLRGARDAGEMTFQVTDLSRVHKLPPESQRKCATAWVKRTWALHEAASLGGVAVTPSAIIRGLVTLVNWWHESRRPTSFVATRQEAFAMAIKAFDEGQVRLRPDLRARLVAGVAPAASAP